eukprot:1335043-Rhodomonas_salina.1
MSHNPVYLVKDGESNEEVLHALSRFHKRTLQIETLGLIPRSKKKLIKDAQKTSESHVKGFTFAFTGHDPPKERKKSSKRTPSTKCCAKCSLLFP